MKNNLFVVPALLVGGAFLAQAQGAAPVKIGILHVQAAIVNTQEGKKAADAMNAKFSPKKNELDKKQSDIDAQEDKLRKGSATLSDDMKAQLMNAIDKGKKQLQRDSQDAQSEFEEEENKVFNELGAKLYAVVEKYAKENGYTMIIDVSAQGQPVWWATDSINITQDVIAAYDKANPVSGGSAAAPATKPPAAPVTAPVRPPVTATPTAPRKQ